MTCNDRPQDLDLLVAGDPVPDATEQHVATCDTCTAEVALAHRIDRALASRASVTAPPALIAAALAQARASGAQTPVSGAEMRPARPLAASRTAIRPDASPRSARGLWRVGGISVALALLAALSWTALRTSGPEPATVVAENEVTPITLPLAEDSLDAETPLAPEAEPDQADTTPEAAQPRSAPEAAPRRRAPRAAPRTQRRAPAPAPEAAPDMAPAPDLVAEAEPSPDDIERAQAELQLAFSLIANAQRQAGRAVRHETGALSSTIDQALPF